MKKHILFPIILLNSLLLQGQECYRTIPFSHTPLYAFQGGHQHMGKKDSVALYCFNYENETLQKVTYQINGKIKPLYENYTCSDFIWAPINLFEHGDFNITIKHYNYLGLPPDQNPASSVYTKDPKGRIVGLNYFDQTGKPTEFKGIHAYKWSYLKNGIGEIRYSKDQKIVPMNNWFPYTWVILNFDSANNLKSILSTGPNWEHQNNAVQIDLISDKKEIVHWIATNASSGAKINATGPKIAEARHNFNENGYLVRTRFYDVDGNRTKAAWGHKGFERTYNPQGNRLSYHFINEKDEIELSEDRGYSGQKFIWDKEGTFRLRTHYMNEKGDPIYRQSRGYASIQYLYDHQGKKIGEIYKDEKEQLLRTEKAQSFILLEDSNGKVERVNL
ncbi:hypothetical protein [Flagellimonas sp.]|uniref:hypothetical protein n=1 Tax=Flagellimonas sp. TaxID=2058762 RepID=UPI003BAEF54E